MEPHEIAYYRRLVATRRGTPGQVGASSRFSQEQRFEVIMELLDDMVGPPVRHMSILDFGCGRGDFAVFLQRHGGVDLGRYIGVDGIEENVEDARAAADCDFRFVRWNGRGPIVPEEVDLIVFSGTFATARLARKRRLYRRLLELGRVGVVGNFLTANARVPELEGDERLIEPHDVLARVDRSLFRVRLRADYKPHDFTIAAIRWDLPQEG